MSIDFALLRQRTTQLLDRLLAWRDPNARFPDEPPSSAVPLIFKLAHIAVGDADSAKTVTVHVLASLPPEQFTTDQIDEGVVLRALIACLPEGWHSWPEAAGPSEWLRLRLRREQADRLLSVLGERDPVERIALALHLLWDVRRDELDGWLGTQRMGERISKFVAYIGQGLELVPFANEDAACREVAGDLIDLQDPQLARAARLHTVGCETCRKRAQGLRQTLDLLKTALQVFFRATPPTSLRQPIRLRRYALQRERLRRWRPALLVGALLALYIGWPRQQVVTFAQGGTIRAAPRVTAVQVIDRALDRFAAQRLVGVLHERVQVKNRDGLLILDRWYDLNNPRLRVTVQAPGNATPILDLATDGTQIAYQYNGRSRAPRSVVVRDADIASLLPLLRQIPFMGSLGDSPLDQRYLDLSLLAEARRSQATLLGTTIWQGRSAYMVLSTSSASRAILTIDQETWSLLEARVGAIGDAAATQAVWQTEYFEVLPRATVPANTWELSQRETVLPQINPRQFVLRPVPLGDMPTAPTTPRLSVPRHLPEPPVIAYLRPQRRDIRAVMQLYESRWSTLVIVVPRQWEATEALSLDRSFARGQYRLVEHARPQTTVVEFALANAPETRMELYYWHALATDAEREAQVIAMLDSMTLVEPENAPTNARHTRPYATTSPTMTGNTSVATDCGVASVEIVTRSPDCVTAQD